MSEEILDLVGEGNKAKESSWLRTMKRFLLALWLCALCCSCEEFGACVFEPYPSSLGNPSPPFDGSFESFRPLAQSFFEQGDFDAVVTPGCICRRDQAPEIKFIDVAGGFGYDDISCLSSCERAKTELGFLHGSDSFATASTRENNASDLTYIIFDGALSADYPNLRFYLGLSTTGPQDFVIRIQPLIDFGQGIDALFAIGNGGIPVNSTDCGNGIKWSRYTISMLPILSDPRFLAGNSSTKGVALLVSFQLDPGVVAAIDNVEFVGPAETNETIREILEPPRLSQSIPEFGFSLLGEESLDVAITIGVFLATVFAGMLIVCLLKCERYSRQWAKLFAGFWLAASTFFSIYAVIEYGEFVAELNDLSDVSNKMVAEVQSIVRASGFDPRQLQFTNNGSAILGAFVNAIPSFSRESVERVLRVKENSEQRCLNSRISTGPCFNSADAYFASVEPDLLQGFDKFRLFSLLEGTVSVSLSHFLDPLLASLVMDLLLTVVLMVAICLHSSSVVKRVLEVFLSVVNLTIAAVILSIALSEPVRYSVEMNLVDFTSKGAIHVEPKEAFVGSSLDLLMDSKGFGVSQVCANSTIATSLVNQYSVYIQTVKLAQLEEFFPKTIGTDVETCDWSNMQVEFIGSTELCVSFDCSKGVVALVREDAARPLNNFVQTQIVLKIVLIDFLVSAVDVLILIHIYIMYRKDLDPANQILEFEKAGDKN